MRAIADYTKAIEISPEFADAYVGRGIVYQAGGDRERAIADYSKAIEIKPAAFKCLPEPRQHLRCQG